jgi:hypothetical protein
VTDLSIPRPIQALLDRELEPGERVEWIAMPKPVFFTPVTTGAFAVSICWTGGMIAVFGVATENVRLDFAGIAVFLSVVLPGLIFLLSPIWAYRRALATVYVITDRRAISFEGLRRTTIRSYRPDRLKQVYRKSKQDGSGDVMIARDVYRDTDGDMQTREFGFLRVPNVRDVEHRLKRLADQAGSSSPAERDLDGSISSLTRCEFAITDLAIPRPIQDVLESRLGPDERIEWMGMPKPALFTPLATAVFLFAIPWTAIAIHVTVDAARQANDIVYPLLHSPGILIGIALASAPIWAYRLALATVYVITNRRAISFQGTRWTTIRNYPPKRLNQVYRKEKQDGSGDVMIARDVYRSAGGDMQTQVLGFLRIPNVRDVERRLKRLAERASRSPLTERDLNGSTSPLST